jgi:branched-chain amino acid transport system permease protein
MKALKDALSFADLPDSERIGFAIFIIFCLIFPWITKGSFAQAVMIQFLIFCLYGLGWNLIGGYGGQVALGQAKNVGMSAYTVALLMVWWDVPFWFSTPLGVIIATVESFILGYCLFRLKGHYFAIATICVSLVWQQLFINWDLIGGARGVELPLKETPNFVYMQFTSPIYYHYFAFTLVLGAILFMNWFRKSKLGYQLRAISASEDVAESLGINIHWVKVKVYCITGVFAGLGGAFYAVYYNYIDPFSVMHLELSIMIALMTMIGGAGSMWGPIIGAMILIPMDRYLGAWLGAIGITGVDFMIYAFMVMIIAAYEPRGIWGIIEKARQKR